MVEVPAATPVTTPVEATTVATPVALLLQVPPEVELLNAEVELTQTVVLPVMASRTGNGLTVMMITLLLIVIPPDVALRL